VTNLAAAYAGWRASTLAQITERLECALVFDVAGPVAGRCVLDAGTGDGTYALEAARRGAPVLAIDTDPAMLAAARRRADEGRAAVNRVRAPIEASAAPSSSTRASCPISRSRSRTSSWMATESPRDSW
jgi:predicted RNA methylase